MKKRVVLAMFNQRRTGAQSDLKPLSISSFFWMAQLVQLPSFEASRRLEEDSSSQHAADLLST
jgi:hypothetical protein